MLKTLKRKIALVAVATVAASGMAFISAPVANAAAAIATLEVLQAGSTLGVKTGGAAAETAAARPGLNTIVIEEAAALVDADDYNLYITTATTAAGITDANSLVLSTPVAANATGAEVSVAALSVAGTGAGLANSGFLTTAAKALLVNTPAGATTVGTVSFNATLVASTTYIIVADPDETSAPTGDGLIIGTITVVAGGAPASLSWAQSTRQISNTAVDYAVNVTPKDANGVTTVLVGAETFVVDITPQTGVSTTQVEIDDASISANEVTLTTGALYAVGIDGANDSGVGATGTTIAGTTYTLTAQLVTGGAAIGAPSSSTYTRVNNSAGLTGTITYSSDNAGATAITAITATPAVAAVEFFARVKDASGAIVVGATLTHSVSGVTDAALSLSSTTNATGFTTGRVVTPAAAGTGTYTSSLSTGSATITAALPITVTGFGAIAPLAAGVTATAVNGNGLVAGVTAGTTWTASRSTTSITLKISGLTASKTARIEPAGTAVDVKAAGVTENGDALNNDTVGFLVADAAGILTIPVTLASAANNNTAIIRVDADAAGNLAALDITITFVDAAAALTTVPASATTSFVAVSSSQTVTASIADQYANPVVGGSVLLTNTSAPALVTLATAVSVNVSNTGTATLTAPIAATIGNYVYTVQARDANGANVGTLSTITYTATADGAPGSVTLTSGGSEAALGSFTVWTSTNGNVPASAGDGANTPAGTLLQVANNTADASLSTDTAAAAALKIGDLVVITVKVANAAGTGIDNVKVGVVGSAGVFLATTIPGASAKLSTMVSTSATSANGGVATIHAVATKVGTNTVTFTVGSKTATATFVSRQGLAIQSIARTVTLGSATVAVTGGAITQSVATVKDAFGNPVAGVALTGTISGVAGRFAGGARSFAASTGADGTVTFEITGNVTESGAGTLTVAGTDAAGNITNADFLTGDLSGNLSTLGILQSSSTTATLAVAAGVADSSSAQIKTDVATANAAVKALATQVTVLQASVATLIDSLTTQIADLMKSVSALTKAVVKLQAKKK